MRIIAWNSLFCFFSLLQLLHVYCGLYDTLEWLYLKKHTDWPWDNCKHKIL